ncbi:ubiquinol oxidase subunit II [Stakelama sediminis]
MLLALSGCADSHGFLAPAGPVAHEQSHAFWFVLILLATVYVPIFLLVPAIAWWYRRGNKRATYAPKWEFSWPLEFFIWGGPIVIVLILSVALWHWTHKLDPYKPIRSAKPPLEVQVVGLDWKWLFIYPDQGIATVNRLVIPVDRPVELKLTTDTVMQSFMVPKLAGQIYAMAGMRTKLNFMASRPGNFYGENTQYNGTGFQKQKFLTRAVTPGQFTQWVQQVRADGKPLTIAQYQKVAQQSVPDKPSFYSSVAPDLFQRIIAKYHPGGPSVPAKPKEAQ